MLICYWESWSHFLRQPVKVDWPMKRKIHHEDAEASRPLANALNQSRVAAHDCEAHYLAIRLAAA